MHDYYFVDNSGGQGVVGIIPVAMQGYLANYRQVCNRTPFITTETGYGSTICAGCNESASEYVQARLVLINMFDHARLSDLKQVYYLRYVGEVRELREIGVSSMMTVPLSRPARRSAT